MRKREKGLWKSTVVKWMALFAVVFALSLPVTAQLCLASNSYRVNVSQGYLALRSGKSYNAANEIGQLYSGELVEVLDASDPAYWYVYSAKTGQYGYVNKDYLVAEQNASNAAWTVKVDKGYLALRTEKDYNASNEIGELYTGDTVEVINSADASYWYVYVPKLNKYGYVNKDYLVSSSPSWTVKVNKGYLALRSTKGYYSSNEIGKLYTGDAVQVKDSSDDTYWYVYVPKLDMFGYVNQQYLYNNSSETRTVTVTKGYLALRNAKGFNASNEIGELYTGDTVQLLDTSDPIYWYVYSPDYGKNGYVDKNYLSGGSSGDNSYPIMTVSVNKGYLALRSAKSYDTSNEIGQLYTGDAVQVRDKSDSAYWYVYSPQLGKYGYVNKDYLY